MWRKRTQNSLELDPEEEGTLGNTYYMIGKGKGTVESEKRMVYGVKGRENITKEQAKNSGLQ